MIKDIAAKRYAKALIESLDEKKDFDKVGEELREISLVFKDSKELQNFFFNPAIPFAKKEKALEDILSLYSFNPKLKSFMHILLKNDWLKIIENVYNHFMLFCDEYNNRVRIEVISAYEMAESEKDAIINKMRKYTGKDVVLNTRIDSEIIGGIVAKIGSLVIDGSVKNYLSMIKNNLSVEV